MDKRTYDSVIRFIKSEITAGRLKPGKKLPPEREMAERLRISRTSIREALRTMEVLGVIESVQGAGNFISVNFEKSMTEALSMMFLLRQTDGRQLSDIRAALELKAAELATQNLTGTQIEELEAIVDEMEATKDEEVAADLDRRLHHTIVYASDNGIMIQILNAMEVPIDDFIKNIRASILQGDHNRERLLSIHRAMISSFKSRDVAALYQAYRRHEEIIWEYLNEAKGGEC
ncbi:MAG: FCD domain-containing protein [Oscillospiraceae bacterium]|nr:FCD domain-containing protein [Oscillospiraceae bacterium]MDD4546650.1 FCD domain-containing protein [Oscillospiraceae bacterium]